MAAVVAIHEAEERALGLIAYEPTDRLTVSIRRSITLAQGVFIVGETL